MGSHLQLHNYRLSNVREGAPYPAGSGRAWHSDSRSNRDFCKMEIRLTLGRRNRLRDFSSWERKCHACERLSSFFKEIKPTISLKNISLISILQNSDQTTKDADFFCNLPACIFQEVSE